MSGRCSICPLLARLEGSGSESTLRLSITGARAERRQPVHIQDDSPNFSSFAQASIILAGGYTLQSRTMNLSTAFGNFIRSACNLTQQRIVKYVSASIQHSTTTYDSFRCCLWQLSQVSLFRSQPMAIYMKRALFLRTTSINHTPCSIDHHFDQDWRQFQTPTSSSPMLHVE